MAKIYIFYKHIVERTHRSTHTYDFLIGGAGHKQVLFILVRVKLGAVGYLAAGEARDALACLRVPQLDVAVVRGREEVGAGVVEADIAYGLTVAVERANAAALLVHLPQLQQ